MLFEYKLTKETEWSVITSKQVGAATLENGQIFIYRLTFNHAIVNKWKNENEIGNMPDLKIYFTSPANGYEKTYVVKDYHFMWKQDQSNQIGRADVVFMMPHIEVGSLHDLNSYGQVSIIFKKG